MTTLKSLKPSFYEMLLADFVAERTPRSRSPDMAICRRLAAEYLKAHPDALPRAIEAADGNLEKVIENLDPPFLEFARKAVPDLLTNPAGLY
ncbi:MAG: hypothetical protein ABIH17_04655 [Pseudomonadota bacterium]